MLSRPSRIAIVHEWLVTFGGSELVLRELIKLFPQARVFTLIDTMKTEHRDFLGVGETTTSFLNRVPGIDRRHRKMLPLYPAAVRSLNVADFDLVISNSHAVAKSVRTHRRQVHLSYCLSPMRYAWDLREQYLSEAGLATGMRGVAARALLESMRRWDQRNSQHVDAFATLSHFVADRIRRAYGREAAVVYPPVDTDFFTPIAQRSTPNAYYITASRFVPYKRVDLIAKAFQGLPDRELIIVGDGPEAAKIRSAAGRNVAMVGHVTREELRRLLQGARAFVFAAEEDFGIAPLEAQACGVPVIAYGRGGATETVRGLDAARPTGVHFAAQSPDAIVAAIREFESAAPRITADACRANAEAFSERRFRDEFLRFVEHEWASRVPQITASESRRSPRPSPRAS